MEKRSTSVLVVDDDVDACRNLADILGDLGYQVDTAHDGESALATARNKPYDILLLDLKMPRMDGLTLYRELRKLQADTVAIIVSAYAASDVAAEALRAGTWQVLPKPVDFARLLPLLEQASGQPLVMVVDDDHDLCENIWSLLRDRGFRVCVAHGNSEAAVKLSGRDFQVVLIDMKLPDGDGRDVYRTVREHTPDAKTVVITGHRSESSVLVEQLLSEGANTVCYKPFDVPQLIKTVERLSQSS